MKQVRRSPLAGWAQLLRLPNLFTVPGDPLAGFVVASALLDIRVVWAAVASVFLYAAGLITNDLLDYREDLAERPHRPLPSGAVTRGLAWIVAAVFAMMGVGSAALAGMGAGLWAGATLGLVLLYNAWAKRCFLFGPLVMGACRASSVLIGSFAAIGSAWPPMLAWVAAGTIGLYIAAVTAIARDETQTRRIGLLRLAPAVAAGLWCVIIAAGSLPEILAGQGGHFLVAVIALLATSWAVQCAKLLRGQPAPARVQRTIGMFIRGGLILQASFLAVYSIAPDGSFRIAGALLAGGALMLWPLAALAGRRFYSS